MKVHLICTIHDGKNLILMWSLIGPIYESEDGLMILDEGSDEGISV